MIIVPIEENHAGLASATDAKFRTPDMSGSGLEALGAGLAKLGDGGQQFATALDEKRRRELAAEIAAAHLDDHHRRNLDDAAAKKAYVDYSDQSAAMLHGENGILNHAGAEAHAAFPTLVAALADSHDEAMAPLDSVQRAIVGPALGERLRSDVARAAAHVRQQGEVEQQVQSRALQTVTARDAVAHADQPDLHDHHMATGENAIRQQAMIGGTPDDERDQQLVDYKSGVHADTVEALARDPLKAAQWYMRYGHELNERDKLRVETTLGAALAPDKIESPTIGGVTPNPSTAAATSGSNDSPVPAVKAGDGPLTDRWNLSEDAPTPSSTIFDTTTPAVATSASPAEDGATDRSWPDGFSMQPAGQIITFDQDGKPQSDLNGRSYPEAIYDAFAHAGEEARRNLSDLVEKITRWHDAKKGWDLLWQDGKAVISSDYVLAHPRQFPGKVLTYSIGLNPAPGILDAGRFATDQLSGRYVTVALATQKIPAKQDISRLVALAKTLKTGVASVGQYEDIGLFSAHGASVSFSMNGVSFTRSYSYDPGKHSLTYSGMSSSLGLPNVRRIASPTAQRSYTVLYDVRQK